MSDLESAWESVKKWVDGIHFETDEAWVKKAEVENKVILGESTETVLGASIGVTAGATVDMKMVESLDLVWGAYQVLRTSKWNVGGIHSQIREIDTQIHGAVTQVNMGAKIQAIERNIATAGTAIGLTNQKVDARVQEIHDLGGRVDACATKTEFTAAKNDAATRTSEAILNQTQALGGKIKTLAEQSTDAIDAVDVLGSHVVTAGEVIETIAAKNGVSGEVTHLAALKNMM